MTNSQKKYIKYAAIAGAAFLGFRWWKNKKGENVGALALAGLSTQNPHQGPRVTQQYIPAGVPRLTQWQSQHAPEGPKGVSSAVVTPQYMGYGSTY